MSVFTCSLLSWKFNNRIQKDSSTLEKLNFNELWLFCQQFNSNSSNMIQSLYRQQIADLYSRNCLSFQKLNCTFCKYSKIDTETCDFISAEILSREACHWVKKSLKSASHIASCWTKVQLRGHFAICTYVFADQVDIAFVIRMFCFGLLTSTWTKACKFYRRKC